MGGLCVWTRLAISKSGFPAISFCSFLCFPINKLALRGGRLETITVPFFSWSGSAVNILTALMLAPCQLAEIPISVGVVAPTITNAVSATSLFRASLRVHKRTYIHRYAHKSHRDCHYNYHCRKELHYNRKRIGESVSDERKEALYCNRLLAPCLGPVCVYVKAAFNLNCSRLSRRLALN